MAFRKMVGCLSVVSAWNQKQRSIDMTDEQTKPCPECGKKMVRKFGMGTLDTWPAQRGWGWWCGCGHTEHGGVESDKTPDQIAHEKWEEANRVGGENTGPCPMCQGTGKADTTLNASDLYENTAPESVPGEEGYAPPAEPRPMYCPKCDDAVSKIVINTEGQAICEMCLTPLVDAPPTK
jgi:hypothetical protein